MLGRCKGCKRCLGPSWVEALGERWHQRCLVCSECGAQLGEQVVVPREGRGAGRPHHPECAKLTCEVCGRAVPEEGASQRFVTHPFFGTRACPWHASDETRRCGACGRWETREMELVELPPDSARVCPHCLETAVLADGDAEPLLQEALGFFEREGLELEGRPPVKVVPHSQLNPRGEGARSCRGETAFQRRPGGPERAVEVRVQKGLPAGHFLASLAHELGHVHLRGGGYPRLGRGSEEGVCQLLAVLALEHASRRWGDRKAVGAAEAAHQLRNDPSEDYGDGLRLALELHSLVGLRGVLNQVRLAGTIS